MSNAWWSHVTHVVRERIALVGLFQTGTFHKVPPALRLVGFSGTTRLPRGHHADGSRDRLPAPSLPP